MKRYLLDTNTVVTADTDLLAVPGLTVENWSRSVVM